jgi:hypothetical protein
MFTIGSWLVDCHSLKALLALNQGDWHGHKFIVTNPAKPSCHHSSGWRAWPRHLDIDGYLQPSAG